MANPKYTDYMKPILEVLNQRDAIKSSELHNLMAEHFHLSETEKVEWLPSGKQLMYKNRIGWATTYLKKAGLLNSPVRGIYEITITGRVVLGENPSVINVEYLYKFPEFYEYMQSIGRSAAGNGATTVTETNPSTEESPQEMLVRAYETIIRTLAEEIIRETINQSPQFFEKLVVDLLVAMGYGGSQIESGQILGKSGDEGIDGVIREDKLGFDSIYIQAKRWDPSQTVGRPELQKFVGALTGQGASKGAFITTSTFSKEAREYVGRQHACKIVLIDGHTLANLMIEHNLGVTTIESYYVKRIDTDYFSD